MYRWHPWMIPDSIGINCHAVFQCSINGSNLALPWDRRSYQCVRAPWAMNRRQRGIVHGNVWESPTWFCHLERAFAADSPAVIPANQNRAIQQLNGHEILFHSQILLRFVQFCFLFPSFINTYRPSNGWKMLLIFLLLVINKSTRRGSPGI